MSARCGSKVANVARGGTSYHSHVNSAQRLSERRLTISLSTPTMSPPSIPRPFSCSLCTVTAVYLSPDAIVHCTGAAPRQRGKSDGWTFNLCAGSNLFKIEFGMIRPNDAVKRR